MLRNFKKSIKIYFFVIIIIPSLLFSYIYYYDPMQIFHKSYIQQELHLHGNMRQQAAGIINNFEFDSIIIGTSMLENTSSFEASKLLGGNFVNISLSGSDFYERNFVLSHALKNKDIKYVIYSIDVDSYNLRKGHRRYPTETFDYLYDKNPFNDFKAYWNKKFFKCFLTFSTKPNCIGNKKTLEYPNVWFTSKTHSDRFGGLDNWFKAKNNSQIKGAFSSIVSTSEKIKKGEKIPLDDIEENNKKHEDYLNEYLLDNVKKYKNTKFIFVFPPYSRMLYAQWKQYNQPNYEIHKAIIKYLVQQSVLYKNLEIYGYEDKEFLDDIANYKDLSHYHQWINSMMLQSFKNKTELLTIQNVDNYIKVAEDKAQNYNIFEISDKIEEYLKNNK
ncbi:hypothetical protein [Aliarcobacter cryaerophilus]|uniref:hypothetical protein n=1 Tax=Aliarcobacter cryaerophilus TaxID=28198 RepID=UPI003DA4C568